MTKGLRTMGYTDEVLTMLQSRVTGSIVSEKEAEVLYPVFANHVDTIFANEIAGKDKLQNDYNEIKHDVIVNLFTKSLPLFDGSKYYADKLPNYFSRYIKWELMGAARKRLNYTQRTVSFEELKQYGDDGSVKDDDTLHLELHPLFEGADRNKETEDRYQDLTNQFSNIVEWYRDNKKDFCHYLRWLDVLTATERAITGNHIESRFKRTALIQSLCNDKTLSVGMIYKIIRETVSEYKNRVNPDIETVALPTESPLAVQQSAPIIIQPNPEPVAIIPEPTPIIQSTSIEPIQDEVVCPQYKTVTRFENGTLVNERFVIGQSPMVNPIPSVATGKRIYIRRCPKCNKQINENDRAKWQRAIKNKKVCKACHKPEPEPVVIPEPIPTRQCPACNKALTYKTRENWRIADAKNTPCLSCAAKGAWIKDRQSPAADNPLNCNQIVPKSIFKNWVYVRHCPECNNKLYYQSKATYTYAIQANSLCLRCAGQKRRKKIQTRKCPNCNKELKYKRHCTVGVANKINSLCRTCAAKQSWTHKVLTPRPKTKGPVLTRACPSCGKTETYKTKWGLAKAVNGNRHCKSCAAVAKWKRNEEETIEETTSLEHTNPPASLLAHGYE